MAKVFADSSILIARVASRTGASRAILTMSEIGLFQLVISEQVDAPILAAAVLAKVDCLLSLNTKDFTPNVAEQSGLRIQTPAQFVTAIREIVDRGLQISDPSQVGEMKILQS